MADEKDETAIIPQRGVNANAAVLNAVVSRYFLRKHSWRGKYYRAFCLTPSAVMTLNPRTLEVTNLWDFKDIVGAAPDLKTDDEFSLVVRKQPGTSKTDKQTFSSPMRAYLLADLAHARSLTSAAASAASPRAPTPSFSAKKVKRNADRKDVTLEVRGWALCQVNTITGMAIATYYYHLMERVAPISDMPGAFVVFYGRGRDARKYLFLCDMAAQLLTAMQKTAADVVGVRLPIDSGGAPLTKESVVAAMRSTEDESVFNTLAEFQALKHTPARHADPSPRIVTLSDRWLVERNPGTYGVITMRPLESIDHVVRPPDDAQAFEIHFRDGTESRYSSASREPLLACLLDCIRATGSRDANVVAEPVKRGLRMTPLGIPIGADAEAQIIKALATFDAADRAEVDKDGGVAYLQMLIATLNANVPYSGPKHIDANRQHRLAVQALGNVLSLQTKPPQAATFHALRRLLSVRSAFESFADITVIREKLIDSILHGIQTPDDVVAYAALEVFAALIVPLFDLPTTPAAVAAAGGEEFSARTTDVENKRLLVASDRLFPALMSLFATHVKRGTSPLLVMGCVDILTAVLCPPWGDTTDAAQFGSTLEKVAALGRDLFKLFHQSNALSVVRGAGMIMKAIIEEGGDIQDLVPKMQLSALVEGAMLRHLHAALFTKNTTQRAVLFKDLSFQLVALWITGCKEAEQVLSRILPPALVHYLESTEEPPPETTASGKAATSSQAAQQRGISVVGFWEQWRQQSYPKRPPAELRKKRVPTAEQQQQQKKNWALMFYQLKQDHLRADLVWNNHTREELREALENELRVFRQEQELSSDTGFVSWNHSEFIVPYDCLRRELNVGGYYLRLLLNPQPGQKAPVLRNPPEFFDMLFHRCLLEHEGELQALCIQALTVVYKFYHKAIGPFRDIAHLVILLRQSVDRVCRDRLLQFFYVLLGIEENAKLFVDNGGVALLVDLMTLVHIGIDHVIAPIQTNLLTAGPARVEGEWFYSIVTPGEKQPDGTEAPAKKERFGPKNMHELHELFGSGVITPSTLCWAQGMEDWKPLGDVPQLRWNLMATGHPILQSTELASLLLDMLTKLCKLYPIRDADGGIIRPIPRPKRLLSSPALLPHVSQMLLTFDPSLVEKTALLLDVLLEDNAAAIPKAYLTGMFFFALVYAGSNLLTIVRLLKRVHMQQHFREDSDAAPNDMSGRSILSPLLPPAMIHLLERRTAEEWVAVFLADSDTPEAIWDHEMRGLLIDRISTHLGNFPQRLQVNPKAIYQYVPVAPVVYKRVQPELFCCHYYLRNFCDLGRFPMWPVDNEIEFLQALLALWAKEADHPAPIMSDEEAITTLKLKPNWKEDDLRRAYFRLAKEFHPDKNPEGKAVFQKITAAYTLLSTREGGDTGKARATLIIRAQSILYTRFRKELGPFKYAGFPLLFTAVSNALKADDREVLHAAMELCYRTIQSSSLNAEELRRQGGIDVLAEVLSHAVGLVMPDTKNEEPVSLTAAYALLTFATAASFDKSRARVAEVATVTRDVCFCLTTAHLPKVVEAALECVCCFALEQSLAQQMISLNVLYLLVPLLFKYDYTLDESQPTGDQQQKSAEAPDSTGNQQQALNIHAQLSLLSLSRLGGLDPACEATPTAAACVRALLSPGIAGLVCKKSVPELLKTLNTNVETPLLLWNSACRNELMLFIETQMKRSASTIDISPEDAQNFIYKTLARELQVGGVYVRLYNEQVRAHGSLPDPKGFCLALLSHVTREAPLLTEAKLTADNLAEMRAAAEASSGDEEKEKLVATEAAISRVRMAAEALRNLLKSTRGMDELIKTKETIISVFTMLSIVADPPTQRFTLEAIGLLTKNADCLAAIADSHVLGFMTPVLSVPHTSPVLLDAITALNNMLGNAKIVCDAHAYGLLLFLLLAFATPTERGVDPICRVSSAAAIAKMSADPVHGSRVQIAVCRFLPAAFLGSMRQEPEAAVRMFDAIHENPELIWSAGTRAQFRSTLDAMAADLRSRQCADRNAKWPLPEDYRLVYDELKDEPEIGGVYIRLFLKQPAWALRNPKGFLEALLTRFVELYTRNNPAEDADTIRAVSQAAVSLLVGTPALSDHAAKTGHLAKIISLMDMATLPRIPMAAAIVSVLAGSQLCAETMASTPATVRALLAAANASPEHAMARALDALDKGIQRGTCIADNCLVAQLLACDGTATLLDVLDGKYDSKLATDTAEAKARTVSMLQKALQDTMHGVRLRDILDHSPIWSNYSGQRHDLFLPSTQAVAGLLTAGPASGGGSIGLLTNTPHNTQAMSNAPPEL